LKHATTQNARVKRVSAAQQKKNEAEAKARRSRLEERLKASENRRRVLMTTPRSKHLHVSEQIVESGPSLRGESALVIQRWWRCVSLRPILENWEAVGLTVEMASSSSFEKIVKIVQSKNAIRAVASVLSALSKLAAKVSFMF
jgi:predicted metal-dependent TIM-barrel fold hydrolase